MTQRDAVIYIRTERTDPIALNRLMASACDALHRRGLCAMGTYLDIGEASDANRPGLDALISDQEHRRAAPRIFVTSLDCFASRTDALFAIIQRLDTAGATLIGPGFDRPIGTQQEEA